jgi:hypothetical protein
MNVCNKLVCLSLTDLAIIVFVGKARSLFLSRAPASYYTRVGSLLQSEVVFTYLGSLYATSAKRFKPRIKTFTYFYSNFTFKSTNFTTDVFVDTKTHTRIFVHLPPPNVPSNIGSRYAYVFSWKLSEACTTKLFTVVNKFFAY